MCILFFRGETGVGKAVKAGSKHRTKLQLRIKQRTIAADIDPNSIDFRLASLRPSELQAVQNTTITNNTNNIKQSNNNHNNNKKQENDESTSKPTSKQQNQKPNQQKQSETKQSDQQPIQQQQQQQPKQKQQPKQTKPAKQQPKQNKQQRQQSKPAITQKQQQHTNKNNTNKSNVNHQNQTPVDNDWTTVNNNNGNNEETFRKFAARGCWWCGDFKHRLRNCQSYQEADRPRFCERCSTFGREMYHGCGKTK